MLLLLLATLSIYCLPIHRSAYRFTREGSTPPPPRERPRTVGASVVPLQFSCKVNLSSAVQVVPAAVWPTCAFELVPFAACATVEAQQQKCSYCFRGYCGAEKRKAVRVEPRIQWSTEREPSTGVCSSRSYFCSSLLCCYHKQALRLPHGATVSW